MKEPTFEDYPSVTEYMDALDKWTAAQRPFGARVRSLLEIAWAFTAWALLLAGVATLIMLAVKLFAFAWS